MIPKASGKIAAGGALDHAADEHHGECRRDRRDERPGGEQHEHDHQQALLAVHVAEPADHRRCDRGAQQVRGEHPADRVLRGVQGVLDLGQRGRDERLQQCVGDAGDREQRERDPVVLATGRVRSGGLGRHRPTVATGPKAGMRLGRSADVQAGDSPTRPRSQTRAASARAGRSLCSRWSPAICTTVRARAGRRHPERIPRALHDERRDGDGVELGESARRGSGSGAARAAGAGTRGRGRRRPRSPAAVRQATRAPDDRPPTIRGSPRSSAPARCSTTAVQAASS